VNQLKSLAALTQDQPTELSNDEVPLDGSSKKGDRRLTGNPRLVSRVFAIMKSVGSFLGAENLVLS
jgi:hypothetical protein